MKLTLVVLMIGAGMAGAAYGQDESGERLLMPGWAAQIDVGQEERGEGGPGEKKAAAKVDEDEAIDWLRFSLGLRGSFLRPRDGEGRSGEGEWYGGAQVRLRLFDFLGVEASAELHIDRFRGESLVVYSYPLQLTGLLYVAPTLFIQPYVLAGAGWYYTHFHFTDGDSRSLQEETVREFGVHVGFGFELPLGKRWFLNADARMIFLDTDDHFDARDHDRQEDFLQYTAGLNYAW